MRRARHPNSRVGLVFRWLCLVAGSTTSPTRERGDEKRGQRRPRRASQGDPLAGASGLYFDGFAWSSVRLQARRASEGTRSVGSDDCGERGDEAWRTTAATSQGDPLACARACISMASPGRRFDYKPDARARGREAWAATTAASVPGRSPRWRFGLVFRWLRLVVGSTTSPTRERGDEKRGQRRPRRASQGDPLARASGLYFADHHGFWGARRPGDMI